MTYYADKIHCPICYSKRNKSFLLFKITGLDGIDYKQCSNVKCKRIFGDGGLTSLNESDILSDKGTAQQSVML